VSLFDYEGYCEILASMILLYRGGMIMEIVFAAIALVVVIVSLIVFAKN